jgi:hypothetical protein
MYYNDYNGEKPITVTLRSKARTCNRVDHLPKESYRLSMKIHSTRLILTEAGHKILLLLSLQTCCWPLAVYWVSWSYTQSVGPIKRWISLYTGQHQRNKYTQASMPLVKFEPTTSMSQREKRVHASDRVASVIGIWANTKCKRMR